MSYTDTDAMVDRFIQLHDGLQYAYRHDPLAHAHIKILRDMLRLTAQALELEGVAPGTASRVLYRVLHGGAPTQEDAEQAIRDRDVMLRKIMEQPARSFTVLCGCHTTQGCVLHPPGRPLDEEGPVSPTAEQQVRHAVARARPYLPDRPYLAYASLVEDLDAHEDTRHLLPDARAIVHALIHAEDGGAATVEQAIATLSGAQDEGR